MATPSKTLPVSIVIPAFNCEEVLAEALESVRTQTFKDFEVIIVDDGSTDGTAAIARRFCELDVRFSLIQQPNAGVSAARNAGIQRARGEWIAFLDGDDVWLPDKLAVQMELSRQNPRANLLFTNYYKWDGQRDLKIGFQPGKPLPEGDVGQQLIFNIDRGCPASMSSAMIRCDMFTAAGIFDPQFAISEDWDLLLRMVECGLWVCGTRAPLVRYRRWRGNVTNQRLKLLENNVRVLGKNFQATKRPELLPSYRSSLASARNAYEVACALLAVKNNPEDMPGIVWRAWLRERRLKWLHWYVCLKLPSWLAGLAARRYVYGKIERVCS